MSKKTIRKAVFPVAGMGSRFLPATKANPKEMLPIVDKPLIQYAVEEAVSAGITELIFITSSSKRSIEDHFDSNYELEARLAEAGKHDLLSIVQRVLPPGISCIYLRQPEPLGLGHAVLCAKNVVGNEPFAVLLADDLIDGDGDSCLQQMMSVYAQHPENILAVQRVKPQDTQRYGIVSGFATQPGLLQMDGIVEKPRPEVAPSQLAAAGRYILQPHIFTLLENTAKGAGGEIQLTDAIAQLLKQDKVWAYSFAGKRYDCGNKIGYLQATIDYALKHPDVASEFKAYLEKRFRELMPIPASEW